MAVSKPSWQLRLANVAGRYLQKPLLAYVRPWPVARVMFNLNAVISYERARGKMVSAATSGGVAGDWVEMPGASADRVILMVHGGGFVMGSPTAYRTLAARIGEAAGARVFLPDYRLAPEHVYPAGLEDVLAAYRGLLDDGHRPEDIRLCGDSAGGGLVMSLVHEIGALGLPMPKAVAVMSPLVDARLQNASLTENARKDPLLPIRWVKQGMLAYAADAPTDDPRLSPVLGDFEWCCPVLIQVGDTEVLRDDALAMAKRLQDQGVSVALRVWPHVPHVWHFHSRRVPEADAGIAEIGAFLRGDAEATDDVSGNISLA